MDKLASKKALFELSTPEEREEMTALEIAKLGESYSELQKYLKEARENGASKVDLDKTLSVISDGLKKMHTGYTRHHAAFVESFRETNNELTRGLKTLSTTFETYAKNSSKPEGFFKDFGTQLTELNGYSKRTSELITNLKWNTTVGLKNSNGSPINPATDGMGLGSFDYTALVQASTTDTWTFRTGGSAGNIVATVVITYTDSTKATILNVVKTPVSSG